MYYTVPCPVYTVNIMHFFILAAEWTLTDTQNSPSVSCFEVYVEKKAGGLG